MTRQKSEEEKNRQTIENWISGPAVEYEVRIDGRQVADPKPVLEALGRIGDSPDHHSAPVNPKTVALIRGDRKLNVVIAEDSNEPLEYWVFLREELPRDSLAGLAGGLMTTKFRELRYAPDASRDAKSED